MFFVPFHRNVKRFSSKSKASVDIDFSICIIFIYSFLDEDVIQIIDDDILPISENNENTIINSTISAFSEYNNDNNANGASRHHENTPNCNCQAEYKPKLKVMLRSLYPLTEEVSKVVMARTFQPIPMLREIETPSQTSTNVLVATKELPHPVIAVINKAGSSPDSTTINPDDANKGKKSLLTAPEFISGIKRMAVSPNNQPQATDIRQVTISKTKTHFKELPPIKIISNVTLNNPTKKRKRRNAMVPVNHQDIGIRNRPTVDMPSSGKVQVLTPTEINTFFSKMGV